jgi:hypothetical protein
MNKQKIILKWLNKEFGNLTIVIKIHKTHYVNEDGEILFYYKNILTNRLIYTNYGKIWFLLKNIFTMTDNEVKSLLVVWLYETYGLTKRIPTMSVLIGIDDTL